MPVKTKIGRRKRIVRTGKRVVIVAGLTLCGIGLAMLVVPSPGILIVLFGLLVFATEYGWADRAIERTRRRAAVASSWLRGTGAARVTVAMTGRCHLSTPQPFVTKKG